MARAPLLPIEAYLALSSDRDGARSFWGSGDDAVMRSNPRVRLALLVGAGHLVDALRHEGDPDLGVFQKLLRYQIRMSTRPTPYGAFAGVALCTVGVATAIKVDSDRSYWRGRPDMEWLLSFLAKMEERDAVLHQLRLVVHPGAFARGGRVILNDPTLLREGGQPISVRLSAAVRAVLERARTPIAYPALVQELFEVTDGEKAQITTLLRELVRQGLLLTNLRPPLTSPAPAAHAVSVLQGLAEPPAEANQLHSALDALTVWNQLDPEKAATVWRSVDAKFTALHNTERPRVQVDLALGLKQSTFGARLTKAAAEFAQLLFRLTPLPHGLASMQAYRAAFEARYGLRCLVPLLELLDPQLGLGIPSGQGAALVDNRRFARRQSTLQILALEAIADRRYEAELDDHIIERLALWDPTAEALPISIDLCLFVLASSLDAVNNGEYQLMLGPNLGSRQAGRYLGRFADMLGARAHAALGEAAYAEGAHAPHAVWAESVYLPTRLRSANVAIRPAIRQHEIAVGVAPGVPAERAIPLAELLVGVQNGRFRLVWRGQEVFVRAGHMLISFHAPVVCRFLEDLAQDNVAQLSAFDWGPAAGFTFLPRTTKGNWILSPAQWRIPAETSGAGTDFDPQRFAAKFEVFRERWQVPRYVYLVEGDNRLLLDLEDPDQSDQLRLDLARRGDRGSVLLHEALPGPKHAWVEGSDGRYLAEFVVPLVLRPARERLPVLQTIEATRNLTTSANDSLFTTLRPPGSDWLFVKVYGPTEGEEAFIAGPLRDFCDQLNRARRCSGWFFVRYSDPDPHIRLRFRGDPNHLLSELLPEVCSWCTDMMLEGHAERFAFDTYQREVERYGGPAALALVEAVFCADSPAVADMLAFVRGQTALDRLSALAISIDSLLSDLGLSTAERHAWYKKHATERHAGGPEFRERKAQLRSFIGQSTVLAQSHREFARIMAFRQRVLIPLGRRFSELTSQGELQDREGILRSVVHMHCNRFVGSERSLEEKALGLMSRLHQSLKEAPVARTQADGLGSNAAESQRGKL